MDGKMLARLGAIIFVAVAITATAVEMTRKKQSPPTPDVRQLQPLAPDPLRAQLRHCQQLGQKATEDAECLAVWAESRDRFLKPSTPAIPRQNQGQ